MRKIENIPYSEFQDCLLDLYLPKTKGFSVFLYFHGGGLESGDKSSDSIIAEYLTKKGIAFISANYRMYPRAVYPQFILDAAAAVAWTKKNISQYGKCENIFVGGSSAGAYLSMMLCFDKKYLAPYGIKPTDLSGFIHDAGQPTAHYNVLREQGLDTRRVIIDESAPIYHIGTEKEYAPMLIIVSDNDMVNRYQETMLMISTMKHFEYNKPELKVMNGTHCQYVYKLDDNGDSILGKIIVDYINSIASTKA